MSYLLDTCILSKLRKIERESNHPLQEWILNHPESHYFISVFTIAEIQAGISKLNTHFPEENRKRMIFEDWLSGQLIPRFKDRILDFDLHAATIWGIMKGDALKRGISLPITDSLIAATAIQYNLVLVTENTKDFRETGARLINPLESLS